MKINSNDIQKSIMQILENEVDDISDIVESTVNDISADIVKELRVVSPKGQGTRAKPYNKGWTSKKEAKNGKIVSKIYNKTNYQLTHLLEFGHLTRNGKRVQGQPHIRKVEEKYVKEFEKNLEQKIKGK